MIAHTELEKLRNNSVLQPQGRPEALLELLISSYSATKEIAEYAAKKVWTL